MTLLKLISVSSDVLGELAQELLIYKYPYHFNRTGQKLMLNITALPQVNASPDNSTAINTSTASSKEPGSDKFSKILAREVSESTTNREANNTSAAAPSPAEHPDTQSHPDEKDSAGTATATTAMTSTDTATPGNASIYDLLPPNIIVTDAAVASVVAATDPIAPVLAQPVNLNAEFTPTISPISFLSPMAAEDVESIPGTPFQATNQSMQQKPVQSGYVTMTNNLWQSLGTDTADFAISGNSLSFSSEFAKSIQASNTEPLLSLSNDSVPTQSFNLSSATSTTSPAIPHDISIDQQVGQPKWNNDFAQKIVWLTTQHNQTAEIRLNPAHLGPVEITLNIMQDQATAQFSSPHLAVREAIEAALPKLREMMAENGIELGNVTVGADSFQQENRQQQAQHSAKSADSRYDPGMESATPIETTMVSHRHQGMVNTFA